MSDATQIANCTKPTFSQLKLAGYNVGIIAEGKIEGSMEIVEMLLIMQQHPHQPIAILALDFWLDLQDVPVFNREPSLGKPLYARLISLFVKRAGYTPGFTDWENEYELDVQEFDEYRRQIVDVIVTSYQILRSEFLSQLLQTLTTNGSEWTVTESVLFMINSASREVCQRIKARGGGERAKLASELTYVHMACFGPSSNNTLARKDASGQTSHRVQF